MTSYFTDKTFKANNFSVVQHHQADFDNCEFIDCLFAGADLSDQSFEDCTFKSCDFSNAKILNTSFKNVTFKSCKLIGLQFDGCNPFLLAFNFNSCILNYTTFYQLKIPGTCFSKCMLIEVDFTEADLSGATFDDCNLSGAIFGNTKLEKADFRGSVDFSIDPEQNQLSGACFSLESLPGLLQKYNIKIG
jgi:fluoroquinolone resistance protein